MPSPFFEDILKSELELIEEIREWPAFSVVKKGNEKKKKSYWNAFNLVPNTEDDGLVKGSEYTNKVICKFAENAGLHSYKEYYESFSMTEVWEELALNRAINYE